MGHPVYTNDAVEHVQVVSIQFEAFDVENFYDVVWIFDGDSSLSNAIMGITSLYGDVQMPLTNIYSSQQYMFVQFTSDFSVTDRGFNATYVSVSPGTNQEIS